MVRVCCATDSDLFKRASNAIYFIHYFGERIRNGELPEICRGDSGPYPSE